jgi:hypothetical protein
MKSLGEKHGEFLLGVCAWAAIWLVLWILFGLGRWIWSLA